jgi:hypothetical protein
MESGAKQNDQNDRSMSKNCDGNQPIELASLLEL